jgi:energy-coupling factor transporter ATPase
VGHYAVRALTQEIIVTAAPEPLIRVAGLHYIYEAGTRPPVSALRGVDLEITAGEHVALVGANGSGKSTLLRHLNALLLPSHGDVWVAGWNTRERQHWRDIRSTVGMVFQSPEAQIVATTVEEDVAFGPENLGIAGPELQARVDWALRATGLTEQRARASYLLSAGQKQRLAIAGALAMRPRCLVLDEVTSMLDPAGCAQVLTVIDQLHCAGVTIVSATHDMGEAAAAQRVVVLDKGCIAQQGSPREVFADDASLLSLKLDLPAPTHMARLLARRLPQFPRDVLTISELVEAVVTHIALTG